MLVKQIENKSIVWFKDNNEYIVVEPLVAEILSLLNNKVNEQEVIAKLFYTLNIPYQQAENLVTDIKVLLTSQNITETKLNPVSLPNTFEYIKHYKVNNTFFTVHYLSEYEFSLVHPKFAHLVTEDLSVTKSIYNFKVYSNKEAITFSIENEIIGTWNLKDVHFFQGKFSMKITELIHNKSENEWLGVFHASAITNGKESMLFLGDSGNGKSTSLALLQANGFTCLADDFVPIDSKNKEVYSFPSAISIKKNSIPTLLSLYPELETSAEYHFKKLNKIVRYLPTNNANYNLKKTCKALVFIKYEKDTGLIIQKISNINAFEQLVPDSWLSPIADNVQIFLDWFSKLPCYQLTYSNNTTMINTVHKIFNDDL